jgi:aminoglycoside phosphotransferase (APT) family kinase protein
VAHGRAIGAFLRVLHAVDAEDAIRHGAQDAATAFESLSEVLEQMERDVLPLLPARVEAAGRALLDRMSGPAPRSCVVHGDLGPEHIRVVGERVGAVIDWGDSCIADPAVDLAWTVFGAAPSFADSVVTAYRPGDEILARGRDWHLLGPWHEVLYGLGPGGPVFVRTGLAGTVARLERFGGS